MFERAKSSREQAKKDKEEEEEMSSLGLGGVGVCVKILVFPCLSLQSALRFPGRVAQVIFPLHSFSFYCTDMYVLLTS